MEKVKVGVVGCAGRMGRMLVRCIHETEGATLIGGTESPGSPDLGADLGDLAGVGALGLAVSEDPVELFAGADAVVDFTAPAATVAHAGLAAQAHAVHVIGTTGLDAAQREGITRAARHLNVQPHRLFQRDGANIFCQAPIPMTTAALGGSIEVPSIDGGRAKVNVPSGTQTGQRFRLKGKGMSIMRSHARGDMDIEVAVETPVNLTKRQQELLREFESAGKGKKTSPESESFFDRVKDFWEDLTD